MRDLHCWDVDVRYSDALLACVLRGVVECDGQVVGTFLQRGLGGPKYSWPLRVRVRLPAGSEDTFRLVSGFDLHEPSEVAGLGAS